MFCACRCSPGARTYDVPYVHGRFRIRGSAMRSICNGRLERYDALQVAQRLTVTALIFLRNATPS